jgi:ribosomal protein S18 acetylase RimI-like enzyme
MKEVREMNIELSVDPIADLAEQARISIAFRVDRIFDVQEPAEESNGIVLLERSPSNPYIKDYDAIAGEGPTRWAKRFDVSNWGLIVARSNGRRVGGAVIAWNTPGVNTLEGRSDLAVLWDIRVSPEDRGRGAGEKLFRAAESWARERGCREIKVETQNINVGACRFYERMGCELRKVDFSAYPELPGEVQMLWYKDLV